MMRADSVGWKSLRVYPFFACAAAICRQLRRVRAVAIGPLWPRTATPARDMIGARRVIMPRYGTEICFIVLLASGGSACELIHFSVTLRAPIPTRRSQ
jgi:hypothetical protein